MTTRQEYLLKIEALWPDNPIDGIEFGAALSVALSRVMAAAMPRDRWEATVMAIAGHAGELRDEFEALREHPH